MLRANKAHTTTVNRIVRRYQGKPGIDLNVDIETPEGIIEVETEATIARGIKQLKRFSGAVYLAVTNREALPEALRATDGSRIGVMDPHGNIIRPSRHRQREPTSGSNGQHNGKRRP